MNNNSTIKLIYRIYLITLGMLSAGFLGTLAMIDPMCTHCATNLAKWTTPRAEMLTGGWLIVGGVYLWGARHSISAFCFRVWGKLFRQSRLTESSQ